MTPITTNEADLQKRASFLERQLDEVLCILCDMIEDKAFVDDVYGKHARLSVEKARRVANDAIQKVMGERTATAAAEQSESGVR